MIIPRINMHYRIQAETGSRGRPLYVLTAYVHSVTGYDTVTGENTGPFQSVPLELFLYRKYNNSDYSLEETPNEKVRNGQYLRVLEPDDLDELNPTLFGTEKLLWGKRDAVRETEETVTLMPAVSTGGVPLTREGATDAEAPVTHNRSGYYKSRVVIASSENISNLVTTGKLIHASISAFVSKYLSLSYLSDPQQIVYKQETIES